MNENQQVTQLLIWQISFQNHSLRRHVLIEAIIELIEVIIDGPIELTILYSRMNRKSSNPIN